MNRTKSEILFEKFCNIKHIRCRRVAVAATRTPDYDIYLARRKVVTEIKEITPNRKERIAEVELRSGHSTLVSIVPGARVRKAISDAGPQIGAGTRCRYPGLLVLFGTGLASGHIDAYQIRVAMYGFDAIDLVVSTTPCESVHATDFRSGGKRKMTPTDNTSISAVAVLKTQIGGRPDLSIYHNAHAKIPLSLRLFARYDVPQYRVAKKQPGEFSQWEEVLGR